MGLKRAVFFSVFLSLIYEKLFYICGKFEKAVQTLCRKI